MVYCDKEQKSFDDHDFIEIEDRLVHVIAAKGASTADEGHRTDAFPVHNLRVVRDADGWWTLSPDATEPPDSHQEGIAPPDLLPPGPE